VSADRQKLNHGRLIEGDSVGGGDVRLRHAEVVRHPPVNVHAENAYPLATVGFAAAAGDAGPASEIGDNVDLLANLDLAALAGLSHFARQFVSDDARIFEKGVGALVNMEISAAYARATDPHEDLPRRGSRPLPLGNDDLAGTLAYQGPHRLAHLGRHVLFVMDKKPLANGRVKLFFI
jgi:hypothetical protein